MVDLPSSPLAEVDAIFEQMALETGSRTFGLAGTSSREKFLQLIAHDVCRLNLGLAFKMHVMAAVKMHSVPYADVLAVIRFIAPYSGYPAAADALGRLPAIAVELGLDTTAGRPRSATRSTAAAPASPTRSPPRRTPG
ncbi:hypothetical protein [Spirillospora sp. NPDC048819]|uniref:hypothetical protein n=1 Tax=Spirillospora sp. NPDC048819 TaxID=3155268 RepID=UPI0033D6A5AA